MYYTVRIWYETDPKLRTVWHPDSPSGSFAVLTRGAFSEVQEAEQWAKDHLGASNTWEIKQIDD